MDGEYTAPYPLPKHQAPRPTDGEFLLPVCTTNERLAKMINALNAYRTLAQEEDLDYKIDVMRALSYIDHPYDAPCVGCSSPEAQCISFLPTRHPERFEFSPGVINGTEDIPAGYAQHPFFTGDRYTLPGFQLLATDVIGDGQSFRPSSPIGFIQQITQSGFPRMRFHWTGSATIELHMIKVPFGGSALIRVDDGEQADLHDLSGVSLTDLAPSLSAIISLIEGLSEVDFIPIEVIELQVDEPGDHHVDVLFIPELQLSITPIRWGGGVRKVVVCGDDVDCSNQECPDCQCDECDNDDCGCGESGCVDCEDC